MKILFIISICFALACSEKNSSTYLNGYQLLRIKATRSSTEALKQHLKGRNETLDIWREGQEGSLGVVLEVLASPSQLEFIRNLNESGLFTEVIQEDVQGLVDEEARLDSLDGDLDFEGRPLQDITWDKYYDVEVMYEYLDMLESTYPFKDFIVVEEIGKSSEGQIIKMAKIHNFTNEMNETSTKRILIDGGTHAREWISPGVAMYIIYLLVERREDYKDMLNEYEWLIVPMVNPDGYEYSRATDRMWRKSRSKQGESPCYGVDLNRNYGFHWKDANNIDELSNPCSNIYAGPSPFSEPETRAIKDVAMRHNGTIIAYFSLHSYGQLWTFPWSYKAPDRGSAGYYALYIEAEKAVKALEVRHGTDYIFGSSSELSYTSPGTSDDWMLGVMGIPLSFTIELRDEGSTGFLLRSSEVVPTAEETLDGIIALLKK